MFNISYSSNNSDIMREAIGFSLSHLSPEQLMIIPMYGLIILVSLLGNLLVCKVILCKRSMRRPSIDVFIANLTVADLLMTLFSIPMFIIRNITDNWPFGQVLCKLVPLVQAWSVYVSVLSMSMTAVDRMQALVKPLSPRLSHRLPKAALVAIIWTLAFILAAPNAIFNEISQIKMLNMIEPTYDGGELQLHEEVLHRCKTVYPNGNQLLYQRISTCLAFATQFLIPLLIVCLCYTVIGVKISKRACIGETTAEQARSQLKSKRKTIKLLILVVMCFALSWLPFNLLHIFKDFKDVQFTLTEHYLAHWFAMCSCVWNPFIYFGLNRRYREGILSVLTCCLPNHIRLAPSSDLTEQNRSTSLLQGTGRKCHHHKHRPKGSRRNNGKCKPTNDHSNGSKMSNVSSLKPLENVNKSNDLEDDNADEVMETTNEQMQSMSIEVHDSKVNRASATELTVRPLGKVQVEVQSDKSNGCPVRRKSSVQ